MKMNLFRGFCWRKWLKSGLFLFFPGFLHAQVPAISRIEYYLDVDPGYGNATNLSYSGTTNATGTITIDIIPLLQGVHILGVRSKDANGAWSHDNKWLFVKPYTSLASIQPNVNRVEWYLDNDPGYGNATTLAISPGQDIAGLSFNINLVPLEQGVHIVGVRSRDANGAWSHDNKWLFVKPYSTVAASQPNVTRVEWYLDNDPGYGNATALAISPATNIPGLSFNIDLAPLTQGVHIVGVRSKDANGAWSHDNKWLFVKPYSSFAVTQPNVTRVEWYLDNDPGYGNATALAISSAQDIAGLSFNIDMAPLVQGVHIVGVRSKDANGAWSHDNKWLFVKPYSSFATMQPNITNVEWYLDNDPGFGKANALAITPAQNIPGLSFNIDLVPLAQGVHIVGVRSKDANGAWSLDNKWIFLKPFSGAGNNPGPNIVKMEYYVDVDPGYGKAAPISITPGNDLGLVVFDANISNVPYGAHKLGIRSLDANGAWSLDNKVEFNGGSGTVWIGVTSTAWNTPSNWAKGLVPTLNDPVTIPSGTPFSPVIATGINGVCKSLKVNPGAVVTVNPGGNLKVAQ